MLMNLTTNASAFDLLNYLVNDPRVRVELREMGFADEELPDWVARLGVIVSSRTEGCPDRSRTRPRR